MSPVNQQFRLAKRPVGMVTREDFDLVEEPAGEPGDGEALAELEYVSGLLGVQRYAVAPAAGLVKVEPDMAPLPTYLGALGMPGMTAYFGFLEAGRPVE